MVKKLMKWILIGIAALFGLVIVGVTLLVAISNYKGELLEVCKTTRDDRNEIYWYG